MGYIHVLLVLLLIQTNSKDNSAYFNFIADEISKTKSTEDNQIYNNGMNFYYDHNHYKSKVNNNKQLK